MNKDQFIYISRLLPKDTTEIIIKGQDTSEVFFSSDYDCRSIGAERAQRGSYKGTKKRWCLTAPLLGLPPQAPIPIPIPDPDPKPKPKPRSANPTSDPTPESDPASEPESKPEIGTIENLDPFADGSQTIQIDDLPIAD